jgi:hypothetical protein
VEAQSSLRRDPEFNAFLARLRRTTAMLEAAMRESARLTGRAKAADSRETAAA